MALSLSLTSNFFIHLLLRSPGQVFFKWPLGIWVLAAFVPHGTRWENMGYSLSFYRKHKAKYSRKKLEFTRISFHSILIRFSSVTQSCPTLCDPMNCSTPGLPVHHQLPESTPIHVHRVGDAIQPSHPLSSPSPSGSNPLSIRVFSSESTLHMRLPKYWSFSFSISPSNEHPGLISFRMDWLGLLAVEGTLKSLLQHHSSKASILWCSAFFTVQISHPYMTTGKTIALSRWTFLAK